MLEFRIACGIAGWILCGLGTFSMIWRNHSGKADFGILIFWPLTLFVAGLVALHEGTEQTDDKINGLLARWST